METTTVKNDDVSVLKIIADKSKRNKITGIARGAISLIVELLFYVIFGGLIAIEILPFESLLWKELLKGSSEIPTEASDVITHIIIIVKLILGVMAIIFLSFGLLLRKLRKRNTTIAEINKLAEDRLKVNVALNSPTIS